MLKANVGLSRKISRDYNSTGYSINVEGEIAATVDDAQVCLERIRELYNLAQEAMDQEIDRDQGEQAIGRRDEEPQNLNSRPDRDNNSRNGSAPQQDYPRSNNGSRNITDEPATNKQVQYVLSLGKRNRLSKPQLESRIEEILGQRIGVYELTKREAGQVIELLNQNGN